jgi:serine/threonine protein kinase
MLGNYNLLEKLGEGSSGTVWKACHWDTKEVVAIKAMPAAMARKPVLLKRFEQEFRLASRVSHPNVVRVIEYCGGSEPFLVMEYVDGKPVGELIQNHGALAEAKAIDILVQVGRGLDHAHQGGLVHRDVKPDNILVTADGVAKLTDLGLGKDLDGAGELTRTGSGLGTPNFMAPEQFRNAKYVDARSDIYSLAATLYQMVTGALPFGHGDPVRIMMRKLNNELTPVRELAPQVSERTVRAIEWAMTPDPSKRPATCKEFLDALLGLTVPTADGPGPQTEGASAGQDTLSGLQSSSPPTLTEMPPAPDSTMPPPAPKAVNSPSMAPPWGVERLPRRPTSARLSDAPGRQFADEQRPPAAGWQPSQSEARPMEWLKTVALVSAAIIGALFAGHFLFR